MAPEPTTEPGDDAGGGYSLPGYRPAYRPAGAGAERAMIAVATVLTIASVGLLLAAAWGASGHSLPLDSGPFTRDLAAPGPLAPGPLAPPAPFTNSASPPPTPGPSVTAISVPSSVSVTAAAGRVTSSPKPSTGSPTPTGRPVLSYEAEARGNVRGPGTTLRRVPAASGGYVVAGIGSGQTLRFAVVVPATGRYELTVYYIAGEWRGATMRVNDGRTVAGVLPATGGWSTVGSVTVPVDLVGGGNTIEFGNPRSPAPDVDRIVLR